MKKALHLGRSILSGPARSGGSAVRISRLASGAACRLLEEFSLQAQRVERARRRHPRCILALRCSEPSPTGPISRLFCQALRVEAGLAVAHRRSSFGVSAFSSSSVLTFCSVSLSASAIKPPHSPSPSVRRLRSPVPQFCFGNCNITPSAPAG